MAAAMRVEERELGSANAVEFLQVSSAALTSSTEKAETAETAQQAEASQGTQKSDATAETTKETVSDQKRLTLKTVASKEVGQADAGSDPESLSETADKKWHHG